MRQILSTLTTAFLFLLGFNATAQFSTQPLKDRVVRCYTVEQMEAYRKSHPTAETDAQFEAWLGKETKNRKESAQRPSANYTIPVVFHIIHNGEAVATSPNLSAALIQEQLLQVNKDFANQANSPYAVAAATGIQFVLAQKDPAGINLAEPGIDRINRNTNVWTSYDNGWSTTYVDGTIKPATTWDATRYLNIWVIPSLKNGTTSLLGYSTFPSTSTLSGLNNFETVTTAGIVILTSTVGSTYLPNHCGAYGQGKTLAHEAGHFFGLRHIWGDANCGNDFCNDTPVHFEENTGVPSHPKSNSCGTPDEMFENYMDYSDDIILNTFTTNQVDRMQTVLLNSPRRASLSLSNVGQVPVTGSNRISFINCSGVLSMSEKGATGSYPRYKDVNLTLNVEDKATSAATVTVVATGTATNNLHYQLLTPSLSFAAGDNYKNVKVRILDNAEVDGGRTIILNYTISGTGVTAGTASQSITLNINDDDQVVVGSGTGSLLNENFGTSGGAFPAGWLTGSFLTPAGTNRFRIGSNGGAGVTGQALYVTNDAVLKPLEYSFDQKSDAVAVTPKIKTAGYSNATLSFNYKCEGQSGADFGALMYSFNNSSFGYLSDNAGNVFIFDGNSTLQNTGSIVLPDYLQDTAFAIGFRWINDDNTGTNPPFLVDDILVTGVPYQVETSVSSSFGFDLRSGIRVNNFKSGNNKVIATINGSSQNLSGVTAQITQAGTSAIAINTGSGNFLRTEKVFQISPDIANTTAIYQATLYFTTAELAVWGADRLNLKILKIKDGVSLASALNSSNAELITPTVVEDATAGYIAYTGNFVGFSQFVLVSPLAVLPVNLISFQATPMQKNIQLVWSTSQEINNRGFMVERSLDGNTFEQIGWVNGNGTTSNTSTYSFTDNYVQRNVTYYYRLRQVDIDNRQVYSQVKNARLKPESGITISVSPNPAKGNANLFITGTSSKATLVLINASGQKLLQRNEINAYNGTYKLPVGGLAKGVYTLVIYLPEGAFTKKLIID